jgi:hypothetical protein
MLSRVPKVSRDALRTDKMRISLVRESRFYSSDRAVETSLLYDVLRRPTGKATGNGYLFN